MPHKRRGLSVSCARRSALQDLRVVSACAQISSDRGCDFAYSYASREESPAKAAPPKERRSRGRRSWVRTLGSGGGSFGSSSPPRRSRLVGALLPRHPASASHPRSDELAGKGRISYLRHGDGQEPEVLLTLDDGPHPSSANRILEALNAPFSGELSGGNLSARAVLVLRPTCHEIQSMEAN